MFKLEHALRPDRFVYGRLYPLAVVRVNVSVHPVAVGFGRIVEEVLPFEVLHLVPIRAHPIHDVRASVDQGPESLFALLKRLLDLLALGDIARRPRDGLDVPVIIEYGCKDVIVDPMA